MDTNTMGKRIAQKRKEKGMTMEQLASALDIQASAVNKYEKGLVENIKRTTILRMAQIFECDPAWLMGFEASKKDIPQYVPEIQEFVNILPKLTKQQIDSLLQTAHLFVEQNSNK